MEFVPILKLRMIMSLVQQQTINEPVNIVIILPQTKTDSQLSHALPEIRSMHLNPATFTNRQTPNPVINERFAKERT
uniref:Uncharacterized protein n=1 Tax=Sphaerodactylus townsendi TaxID=933632 RepID=A0ACB8FPW3_9SAUR